MLQFFPQYCSDIFMERTETPVEPFECMFVSFVCFGCKNQNRRPGILGRVLKPIKSLNMLTLKWWLPSSAVYLLKCYSFACVFGDAWDDRRTCDAALTACCFPKCRIPPNYVRLLNCYTFASSGFFFKLHDYLRTIGFSHANPHTCHLLFSLCIRVWPLNRRTASAACIRCNRVQREDFLPPPRALGYI